MAKFKDIIREARKKRLWTQKDVAAKIGITGVAYGDYERGRIYPTPGNLRLICNLFEKMDFNEMSVLIEQEKRQEELKKTQQRISVLQPISFSIRQMVDFVKVLLKQVKTGTYLVRVAAAPVNINPQRSVPALVLKTIEQTFVEVADGPFLNPDGSLSLNIKIPAANLPAELKQEVKVDLLFLPIGEIVHTFTLSSATEQRVEVEFPTEHPDLKDLFSELKEVAEGPIQLPLATVSFRIR